MVTVVFMFETICDLFEPLFRVHCAAHCFIFIKRSLQVCFLEEHLYQHWYNVVSNNIYHIYGKVIISQVSLD